MNARWLVAGACMLAGDARADAPDALLAVQADFEIEAAVGSRMYATGLYLDLSYVRLLPVAADGWQLFGGLGLADDVVTYWQRDDRRAPDAIAGIHSPGVELRIGMIHGTQLGAPRFVVKATPMWSKGTDAMGLPGDRGLGLRASLGFAWPAWLLGRIDPDPPGTKSYEQTSTVATIFAALVPSEVEYVFEHVPGDNRNGVAFGVVLLMKRAVAMVLLIAGCSTVEPGSTFDLRLTYDGTRHDAVAVFPDWPRPIANTDPVRVGGSITGDPQIAGISLIAADHITYDVGITRKPGDDSTSLPLECLVDEADLGHTVACTGSRYACSIVVEARP